MTLNITEFAHVHLTVPRTAEAAAKHFYGTLLGLTEIPKPESLRKRGGSWYQCGLLEIHVGLEDGVPNETSRRHICFMVADITLAEATLREAGMAITPDDQPIAEWVRFYVRDPGGNRIEIAQRVEDRGLRAED